VAHLKHRGKQLSEEGRAKLLKLSEEAGESILENAPKGVARGDDSVVGKILKMGTGYATGVLFHGTHLLRYLDGRKNGLMYRLIKQPIDDAINNGLIPAEERAGERASEIYNEFYSEKELTDMHQKEEIAPGLLLSKWEMIGLVRNFGTASNLEAVKQSTIDGVQPYTDEVLAIVLDRMEKRDMDFIQRMIDDVGQYQKELFDLERRLNGVVPPKVEALPIETKHGTYPGGYFRLMYDSNDSWRVTETEMDELYDNMRTGRQGKAKVSDAMMQERVGSGGKPVRLDPGVWHTQVKDILRRIHLTEAVDQAQKVLASRPVIEAVQRTRNQDYLMALDVWLKDTAVGEVVAGDAISRGMRAARTGMSAASMAYNPGTMLVQPLGIFNSIPAVGAENIGKGLIAYISGKEMAVSQIHELSGFMKKRHITFNKDLWDTFTALNGNPTSKNFMPKWFRKHMFTGIAATQSLVDNTVWLGAYQAAKNKADAVGTEQADWVREANQAVARTQGSGVWSDRTPIERGSTSAQTRQAEAVKIWSTFGVYFFAKGNLLVEMFGKTNFKSPKEVVKLGVDLTIMNIL
jgi:hypothetical protein